LRSGLFFSEDFLTSIPTITDSASNVTSNYYFKLSNNSNGDWYLLFH
jgi:hypothetical protein